ncbi:MAG TPA: thiamine phosphate synthase [Pyrinomonadaceae bacterium]|nr:thiamine phosphate synthase [Pyrinomonadaceae bacterium]
MPCDIPQRLPQKLPRPIIYPITSGKANSLDILRLVRAAVEAEVPLFQIREKSLPARELYELTSSAVELTRGSKTRLLVNDRADIARAAGADGVHLTSQSLPADVVRSMFGSQFLIGVSTHSLDEARTARDGGADFIVFGPVFEKHGFSTPQGLDKLRNVTSELGDFPVLAIGGVSLENARACFEAGASGVAAIRLLNDPESFKQLR